MRKGKLTYRLCVALLLCLLAQAAGMTVYGQDRPRAGTKRGQPREARDSLNRRPEPRLRLRTDSLGTTAADSLEAALRLRADTLAVADSLAAENRRRMLEMTSHAVPEAEPLPEDSLKQAPAVAQEVWIPNPTKATWMALVIPGGGQIYNRKYWKLPIIYGGFAGCAYALTWNGKMYKDYSRAYKDMANGNRNSNSITDLLPPNYNISDTQLLELLRKRKDTYRRYRDLSIFAFIGVYLLSVVDAYVDAELSNFDITPDLSMKVEPALIGSPRSTGLSKQAVGLQCSLRF